MARNSEFGMAGFCEDVDVERLSCVNEYRVIWLMASTWRVVLNRLTVSGMPMTSL